MAEPQSPPPPAPEAPPLPDDRRTFGVRMVAALNGVISVTSLGGLLVGQLPPGAEHLPAWYFTFAKVDLAVALAASVGLWLLRRWGFGLLVLAYFSSIIALVVMRQHFVCQAAFQFPLLAIASLGWRALK